MNINKLKLELIAQRKSKFKGNIYHYSQVNFAYNSNKIEGGRLTEDETEEIFETDSFIPKSDTAIKLDDLIEMKNHFRLFDYTLDIIDKPLSKEIMIDMNKILKRNTTDEENPRYNVGGFKVVPNKIGLINVINTSKPEDVEKDLDILISEYEEMDEITLEDIIDFHYKFELIHPFQDGNGRVGRMIILKQCLDNNIIPIIIRDDNKAEYYRSLNKAQHENDYSSLVKYFQKEQKYYVDNTEKMLFAYEELEK